MEWTKCHEIKQGWCDRQHMMTESSKLLNERDTFKIENASLKAALVDAEEYMQLILGQSDNFPEDAAINIAKFATDGLARIHAALKEGEK